MINSTSSSVDVLKLLLIRLTTCGQSGSGIKLILERHFIIFTSSYQNPYRLYWIVMTKAKILVDHDIKSESANQNYYYWIIFSRFLNIFNRTRRQRNVDTWTVQMVGRPGSNKFAFLGYASYNPSQARVWWHIRHMICPFQMGDFLKKPQKLNKKVCSFNLF